MNDTTKNKVVFWLKLLAAVIAAVLSVLGVTSVTSCTTSTTFTMSSDTLYMDNPRIQFTDSTSIHLPYGN